jgi:outer membrane protein OmpA-like peptidoglycan-associated protein
MKKYFLIASLFTAGFSFAQDGYNLVDNGSFESITGKGPKKLGGIESATNWVSATGAKADLFVASDKIPEIDASKNVYGTEAAQDGANFAGVMIYAHGNKIPRTYLSQKLSSPLKKDETYCVKFYVSLGDNSKYASNNIAAHFSKKEFAYSDKKSIIGKPHVLELRNKVFSGTYSWERVCGTFTADGSEKFITIGNFSMTEETNVEKIKKDASNKNPQVAGAYYFIDNISVQLLEEDERCDCGSDDFEEIGSSLIYSKTDFIKESMSLEDKLNASTIYFGFGRDMITGGSTMDLDRIAQWMKDNPTVKVRVVAHIDTEENRISETKTEYKGVAMRRANSVIKYLMDQGVEENRLIATDKGDRAPSPTDSDDEELNQAKNRRVEFVLIK